MSTSIKSNDRDAMYNNIMKSIINKKINHKESIECFVERLADNSNHYNSSFNKELINRFGRIVQKLGGDIRFNNISSIVSDSKNHLPNPDEDCTTIRAGNNKLKKIISTICNIFNELFKECNLFTGTDKQKLIKIQNF